ncbi:hypothetical protein JCM17844_18200 [Iodidimonas gelatinilytica]|uniref:Flagellar hook-length control protein-like C-terminal domain-containing protein n=1 Tax=Iodidimonas gelatinilytica TaxID=1236966 RepID=A0A5A7MSI7_9PROT|nr:flagellar hook-length control protein FliK [Iodidimonas gelatinilytica]GEQ98183.1 hypothetical protein JCM17844_18200 [Iodidimonas gelatinilytica]
MAFIDPSLAQTRPTPFAGDSANGPFSISGTGGFASALNLAFSNANMEVSPATESSLLARQQTILAGQAPANGATQITNMVEDAVLSSNVTPLENAFFLASAPEAEAAPQPGLDADASAQTNDAPDPQAASLTDLLSSGQTTTTISSGSPLSLEGDTPDMDTVVANDPTLLAQNDSTIPSTGNIQTSLPTENTAAPNISLNLAGKADRVAAAGLRTQGGNTAAPSGTTAPLGQAGQQPIRTAAAAGTDTGPNTGSNNGSADGATSQSGDAQAQTIATKAANLNVGADQASGTGTDQLASTAIDQKMATPSTKAPVNTAPTADPAILAEAPALSATAPAAEVVKDSLAKTTQNPQSLTQDLMSSSAPSAIASALNEGGARVDDKAVKQALDGDASINSVGVFSRSASKANQASQTLGSAQTATMAPPQGQAQAQAQGQTANDPAAFSQAIKNAGGGALLTQADARAANTPPSLTANPVTTADAPINPLSSLEALAAQASGRVPTDGTVALQGSSASTDNASHLARTHSESPATQVAMGIAKAASDGKTRFTIRMDPPELGKIEVKLDLMKDGGVKAIISADNRDAYDMLQRDSRALERLLNDAGLKTDNNSLNFSFNQQGGKDPGAAFAGFDTGEHGHGQEQGQTPEKADLGLAHNDPDFEPHTQMNLAINDGLNIVV